MGARILFDFGTGARACVRFSVEDGRALAQASGKGEDGIWRSGLWPCRIPIVQPHGSDRSLFYGTPPVVRETLDDGGERVEARESGRSHFGEKTEEM